MAGESYLVVGLGNIGAEYALTRHNMGFMVLDAWAQASGISFVKGRYADYAEIPFRGRHIYLVKPSTYMNLSGNAVRYYLQVLPVPIERLVVVCDDINLPFGTVRMRKSGSDGGHNGLKDIAAKLGTQQWCRIRLGVGHEFSRGDQIDYVLSTLSPQEQAQMPQLCERVVSGIEQWVMEGPDRAMNSLNVKASKTPENETKAYRNDSKEGNL